MLLIPPLAAGLHGLQNVLGAKMGIWTDAVFHKMAYCGQASIQSFQKMAWDVVEG
jgi:hypothetical protein